MALITESESLHHRLEELSTAELLQGINQEDQKVAVAVQQAIPAIEALVNAILPGMRTGGRLFYIGAGTSGRLGIVDASECPPTFGVDHGVVVGLDRLIPCRPPLVGLELADRVLARRVDGESWSTITGKLKQLLDTLDPAEHIVVGGVDREASGLHCSHYWTDPKGWFGVFLAEPA